MILLHPEASTWLTFSRTGVASPTVSRPFNVRMDTPSSMRSVISKLIRLVYTGGLQRDCGGLGRGRWYAWRAHRQAHCEPATFADLALDLDGASVSRNDPGHETEAETQPLQTVGVRVAHAQKTI